MNEKDKKQQQKQNKKPNEASGMQIDDHLKIFDPNTNKVIVNKRN